MPSADRGNPVGQTPPALSQHVRLHFGSLNLFLKSDCFTLSGRWVLLWFYSFYVYTAFMPPALLFHVKFDTLCCCIFCLSLSHDQLKPGVSFPQPHCCCRVGQRRFLSPVGCNGFLHQPRFHIPADVWSRSEAFFTLLSRFKRPVYHCLLMLRCCFNEQLICSHHYEWVCLEY